MDLAFNLETRFLLKWCNEHNICFVNTSLELWDPFANVHLGDPRLLTLYYRQMQLIDMQNDKTWNKKGATAIIDHGCNPGLVSHFVKRALIDMTMYVLNNNTCESSISTSDRNQLKEHLNKKDYSKLAYLLGVKTIHISERDTQITNVPKKVNEFVNTWSIEGLAEEAVAPAEMGWGTHEKDIPDGTFFHKENEGPCNQVCLSTKGMKYITVHGISRSTIFVLTHINSAKCEHRIRYNFSVYCSSSKLRAL